MLSCCLSHMFCSLRSQIFFTVRTANKQESRTKMMQLHKNISRFTVALIVFNNKQIQRYPAFKSLYKIRSKNILEL